MASDPSRAWRLAAWLLIPLLAAGCAGRQFGPRAVLPAQRGYNEAIGRALDQQLLLNLVRLRYRENPLFLEFSSVVAQFNRHASLGASLKLVNGGADEHGLSAGIGASETPVLTLVPVKGRDFVQRMLAPIQIESLVALLQSGWSVERLLICCVQQLAGIRNADLASSATPLAPEFERFHDLARALGAVQRAGGIDLAVDDQGAVHLDLERGPDSLAPERATITRLFGLAPGHGRVRLVGPRAETRAGDVVVLGRSFYGLLQLLAQGVEVPPADEARGVVTVTRTAEGGRFDWRRVLGGVFTTRSGPAPPDSALAVFHRGSWFWIADDDRDSKTTFSLVSLLTSLKSSEAVTPAPVLAIGR